MMSLTTPSRTGPHESEPGHGKIRMSSSSRETACRHCPSSEDVLASPVAAIRRLRRTPTTSHFTVNTTYEPPPKLLNVSVPGPNRGPIIGMCQSRLHLFERWILITADVVSTFA